VRTESSTTPYSEKVHGKAAAMTPTDRYHYYITAKLEEIWLYPSVA
jgi:hypothetical protein